MASTAYHNVEIPLDNVVTPEQRAYVPGAEPGTMVYGVTVVPANFVDPALPTGAQVRLYFGQNDEIILTDAMSAFDFPCGHDAGVFFSNAAALVGKKVRLLLDYSGITIRPDR